MDASSRTATIYVDGAAKGAHGRGLAAAEIATLATAAGPPP